jgi:hypothetical protein
MVHCCESGAVPPTQFSLVASSFASTGDRQIPQGLTASRNNGAEQAVTFFSRCSSGVCQNPRFQPTPAVLKTRWLVPLSLLVVPVPKSTLCGTPWLEQAAQTNRLNMRKAVKGTGFR